MHVRNQLVSIFKIVKQSKKSGKMGISELLIFALIVLLNFRYKALIMNITA